MTKKENLNIFHKKTISGVADKLFIKKGLDNTTMDEIAKEADYSKATIYVYFKNKNEIFLFNLLKHMNFLYESINNAILKYSSAIDQYYEIFSVLKLRYNSSPIYFKSMIENIEVSEKKRKEQSVLEDIYIAGEKLNEAVSIVLENGVKQSVFRKGVDNIETGLTYWFSLAGIIISANNKNNYINQRLKMEKEDFLDYSSDLLLHSILKDSLD